MVYTRNGDGGNTDLMNGNRVRKTNVRIEAYGTVDELNSCIGTIRPVEPDDIANVLKNVQNNLHIIQSELSNPEAENHNKYPQIETEHVENLEDSIDKFSEELEPTDQFILPGGSETGSNIHLSRSICRRAERRVIALDDEEKINDKIINYLNRLSDLLFVIARLTNQRKNVTEENPTY